MQSVLEFMGRPWGVLNTTLEAGTDSSAAKSMAERLGVGPRVRHLDVNSLWLQDAVKKGLVKLAKLKGQYNSSDLGTKALDAPRFAELKAAVGCVHKLVKSDIINMKPRNWEKEPAVPLYDVGAMDTSETIMKELEAVTAAIRRLVIHHGQLMSQKA